VDGPLAIIETGVRELVAEGRRAGSSDGATWRPLSTGLAVVRLRGHTPDVEWQPDLRALERLGVSWAGHRHQAHARMYRRAVQRSLLVPWTACSGRSLGRTQAWCGDGFDICFQPDSARVPPSATMRRRAHGDRRGVYRQCATAELFGSYLRLRGLRRRTPRC